MQTGEKRAVTVLLTEEHLQKMIEEHLLKEDEIGDRVKIAPHRAKAVGHRFGTTGPAMARVGRLGERA